MFWYENMVSSVKWGSAKGREFGVPLGIKQGGINSPDFFSVYFDDLTKLLRKQGIGCFIGFTFLASIFYADDICLLAPNAHVLQKMVTICERYAQEHNIVFSTNLCPAKSKTKCVLFSGKKIIPNIAQIKLDGSSLP